MNETAKAAEDDRKASASPARERSNLGVRLLTTSVLGPLLLALLFYGPAWAWALFIALSSFQVAREMLAMTHPEDKVSQIWGATVSGLMTGAAYLATEDPRLFASALALTLIVGAMMPLLRLGEVRTAALRMTANMSAPLYVGVLLSAMALIRRDAGEYGAEYVFFTLQIAWMGDTGGYVFGRIMGRTKLYPAVSPKKTREGLLGSVLFSTAAALLASFTYLPQVPPLHSFLLGSIGACLGLAGDLVESLMKRSTGVKDSGSVLPGHGGLFDRVDALLVVGPLVYLYIIWVQ